MEINTPVNISELEDALANSNNSAIGSDNLNCEMLKHMPNHCLQILLLLCNRVWFTGEIRPEWLHSISVALHKFNKPVNLPQSYRQSLMLRGVASLFPKGGQALTHGGGSKNYKGNPDSSRASPPRPPNGISFVYNLFANSK